jgi:hypothetical protein
MRPAPRLARAGGVLQCRGRDVDFVASATKRWARGTPRLPDAPKSCPTRAGRPNAATPRAVSWNSRGFFFRRRPSDRKRRFLIKKRAGPSHSRRRHALGDLPCRQGLKGVNRG